MTRVLRCVALVCLLLTACRSAPAATPTPPGESARLPTRRPVPTPTGTPVAISAGAYYERGVESQRAGDAHEARRYFRWAIQTDMTYAPAYVARGSLHLAEGRLNEALQDADAALEIEPTARAYLLRAEVLRELADYDAALLAFDRALEMDPALSDETFPSRWKAARRAGAEDRLLALGNVYASAHPADPVRHYYLAWVPYQAEAYLEAIHILRRGIALAQNQPAVLWYLLGRSYIGIGASREAILSLETARHLIEVGDASMLAHTDVPIGELSVALGRAYLSAYRCTDAEAMIAHGMSLGAPMEENLETLERARFCPTPTPTVVPWATPTAVGGATGS